MLEGKILILNKHLNTVTGPDGAQATLLSSTGYFKTLTINHIFCIFPFIIYAVLVFITNTLRLLCKMQLNVRTAVLE